MISLVSVDNKFLSVSTEAAFTKFCFGDIGGEDDQQGFRPAEAWYKKKHNVKE